MAKKSTKLPKKKVIVKKNPKIKQRKVIMGEHYIKNDGKETPNDTTKINYTYKHPYNLPNIPLYDPQTGEPNLEYRKTLQFLLTFISFYCLL